MPSQEPTERFSDRVDSYVRARPDYPAAMAELIERETALRRPASVADVGSGTGIFTRQLLARGHTVYAVEPNLAMRQAAERALAAEPGFRSVAGRAEATTLPDACVDLVTSAQAFHWFDTEPTRDEWRRILRPPRPVALLWNDRQSGKDAFGAAYEDFLERWGGEEYRRVRDAWAIEEKLDAFFGASGRRVHRLPHEQRLDLPGLEARLLSSSYLPGPDHPRRAAMLEDAARLFHAHARDGAVTLLYETRAHLGHV